MRWIKLYLTYICLKNFKLTHRWFNFSPSIYSSWIYRVIFLHFWLSKIHVNLTIIVFLLFSSPVSHLLWSISQRHYAVLHFLLIKSRWAHCIRFIFRQYSVSCLSSQAVIEALNLHHHRRSPSPGRPTLTLHYYKKSF
jgi:hypothetical protein